MTWPNAVVEKLRKKIWYAPYMMDIIINFLMLVYMQLYVQDRLLGL